MTLFEVTNVLQLLNIKQISVVYVNVKQNQKQNTEYTRARISASM